MTQLVEQLHYTWTPRGVEGANRFQIAAISPGLRAGDATAAMPMVRRLCSYESPRGAATDDPPVSFGWLDHGELRLAFHRIGLPPARGRPGNFAAHILVGPPPALPEGLIGRSFGSSLWWRGTTEAELEQIAAGKREFELPAIDLEEALARAEPGKAESGDREAAMSLAHAVLTLESEQRLAVLAEGAPLGRAVRLLAELVPEALADLTLSTYEGKPFFPFRVIGTAAPEPSVSSCPLALSPSCDPGVRATVEGLLAEDQAGGRLRSLAGAVARKSSLPREALWRTARAAVAIASADPPAEAADLMANPDAVAFLATTPAGQESLAAAAQSGMPDVLGALARAVPRLEPELHDGLCAAIAERCVASGQPQGCAALLGSFADGPAKEAALGRVFAIAAADTEAAAALGADDASLLLGVAADRGAESDSIRDLLRASSRHLASCAAVRALPDAYIAAMLRDCIDDSASTKGVEQAIVARPALVEVAALADVESLRLLELAERATAARVALLLVLLRRLPGDWSGRAISVANLLPPATAAGVVTTVLHEDPGLAALDELCELCDSLAASLLASGGLEPALELLQVSGSEQAPRALRALRDATEGRGRQPIEAMRALTQIDSESLRGAVAEIVLDRAVDAIESPGDVDRVWFALASLHPRTAESERLRTLLACAAEQPRELPAATILGWTATTLVARHPKLLDRLGHLDDEESEEMARTMVEQISEWRMAQVEASLEFERRRGRKWWHRLEGHRKKIADAKG